MSTNVWNVADVIQEFNRNATAGSQAAPSAVADSIFAPGRGIGVAQGLAPISEARHLVEVLGDATALRGAGLPKEVLSSLVAPSLRSLTEQGARVFWCRNEVGKHFVLLFLFSIKFTTGLIFHLVSQSV